MQLILDNLEIILTAALAALSFFGIKWKNGLDKAKDVLSLVSYAIDAAEDGKITKEEIDKIKELIEEVTK